MVKTNSQLPLFTINYNQLQSNYNQLQSNYNQLQSNYNQLQLANSPRQGFCMRDGQTSNKKHDQTKQQYPPCFQPDPEQI